METIESLKEKFRCKTNDELGAKFHLGGKAVSAWKRNGIPEKILLRAKELLSQEAIGNKPTAISINGHGAHIDVHHGATVNDAGMPYSPFASMICDLVKDWPEKQQKKGLKLLLELDENQQPEEEK